MKENRNKNRIQYRLDTINILNSIKVILEQIKEDILKYRYQNIDESSNLINLIEKTKLLMETMNNGDKDVRKQ